MILRLLIALLCLATLTEAAVVSSRRARHVNPRHAGASHAWDTRFNLDGHTAGSAVGTWTDRGGTTATEATNRPSWQNNSTDNIGGNPVVRFDGINDVMSTSSITVQTACAFLFVGYRPWTVAKYAPMFSCGYSGSAGKAVLTTGGSVQDWLSKDMIMVGDGFASGRNPRAVGTYGSIADNSPQLITGEVSSTSSRIWIAGRRISTRIEGTASVPTTTATLQLGAATGASDFGNHSYGQMVFFRASAPSSPLRRRLEHAAAFAFKLRCN